MSTKIKIIYNWCGGTWNYTHKDVFPDGSTAVLITETLRNTIDELRADIRSRPLPHPVPPHMLRTLAAELDGAHSYAAKVFRELADGVAVPSDLRGPDAPPIICERVGDTDDVRPTWEATGRQTSLLGDEWEVRPMVWGSDSVWFSTLGNPVVTESVYLVRRCQQRMVMVELPEDVAKGWANLNAGGPTGGPVSQACRKALGMDGK